MPITQAQIAAAQAIQHAAAHDASSQVRLVAGPGTGKSASIEERVSWLLGQGTAAQSICAISFTRASSTDLRLRVHGYCTSEGHANATQVGVTTMHSLGLRLLQLAGQLQAYPVSPLVLDDWETENIFDAEYRDTYGGGIRRARDVRADHDAFWNTGVWLPPNLAPPNPPISAAERAQFDTFHGPRTQTYACVLPGEIIRQCVEGMAAGVIDPVALLNIEHLVVDEFQDLNPLDLHFVREMSNHGVKLFVAGDDDQSVYSFRYADPSGIQDFPITYPGAAVHALDACFRCPPNVLDASTTLIAKYAAPNRIAKNHHSLYAASAPVVNGTVHRWQFSSHTEEALYIAESCQHLIAAGMSPREILILVGNLRQVGVPIRNALDAEGIAYEHPREDGFLDSEAGRLVFSLIRIACDQQDYIAHRTLLGQRRGTGLRTSRVICDEVIANALNFRNIFYNPLPGGVFTGHRLTAVNRARDICAIVSTWSQADTIDTREAEIGQIIGTNFDAAAQATWNTFRSTLPGGMTLEELRDFFWTSGDDQEATLLTAVLTRLGEPIPAAGVVPPRVRIMTMHGAKGLSARVVFIPGLEEQVFPGAWRVPYPGLILEAARLLYVSITRARAACVISYASHRMVNGTRQNHAASRYTPHLNGAFGTRGDGLTAAEVTQIMTDCSNL